MKDGSGRRWLEPALLWAAAILACLLPLGAQPPPFSLTGTVRSAGGADLVEARVALRPMASNFSWARATLAGEPAAAPAATAAVDADGRFRLAAPGAGLWEIEITAAGHLPLRLRTLAVTEPAELPTALLPPAETARVEVRDSGGHPVADARVLAESASENLWREEAAHGWRPAPRLGRTDRGGRIAFPRAPDEELRVSVAADGTAPVGGRGGAEIRVVLPADRHRRSIGLRSNEGVSLAGVVVLAGEPALPVGATGPDGRFDLRGEPPSLDLLYFAADGRRGGAPLGALSAADAGGTQWLVVPRREVVRGRVTDRAGLPLEGAVVWPRHDPGTAVRTDEQGRFEINRAPYPRWAILAEAAGFLRGTVQMTAGSAGAGAGSDGAALRLVLARRRPVIGRVMDVAGRPVAGAEVAARAPATTEEASAQRAAASTDPDGRFSVPQAPAARFAVEIRKPGYAPLRWPEIAAPPGEGPIDLGVLRLVAGAAVRGKVSGREGAPIAGAEVWLGGPGAVRPAGDRKPSARTDPAGAFRIADLRPGEPVDLRVVAEGYLPATVEAVVPPPAEPLAIRLVPAAKVSGRVLDGAGRPVVGAAVDLLPRPPDPGMAGIPRPAGARELSTKAGEAGRFSFSGVAPGEVVLEAVAAGFQRSASLAAEVKAGADLRDLMLVLPRGATVEGSVSDRRGEPVGEAQVRIGRARGASDGTGRFRVEGVAPGPQLAEVEHRDYNRLTERLEIPPEGTSADFVLTGGWPVAGRVVDEQDAPVADVQVDLQQLDRLESRTYRARSGEDGLFRFPRVAEGRYSLAAARDGYSREDRFDALAVAGAAVEDVEVVLLAGVALRGRILGLEPADLPRVHLQASRLEGGTREGRVDPAGRYEIADLNAGEWQVAATLAGGRRQAGARLTVPSGARLVEHDLQFGDGLTLSGLALFDGRELAGARVSLRGLDSAVRRNVATDYRGTFRIEGLDAGLYRFTLAHPNQLLVHNEDLELAADREVVVDLRTAEVRGRVTSQGGRPLAGVTVALYQYLNQGAEPASLFTVVSGPEGTFRQARLAPGRYRMAAQRDDYAPAERWLDLAAGATEEVEIELKPTAGLDLALRFADGRVPLVMTVAAFGPDGALALAENRGLTVEGFTRLASLPAGTWELRIGAPGAAVARYAATVPSEAPLKVVLQPEARLKVRIPALAGRDELATITLVDAAGRAFQMPEPGGPPRGTWQFAAGVGWVEGLPAGSWTVHATGPHGESWQRTATLDPGATRELVLGE